MNIYKYQRLVGKINDIPELRDEFIVIYDAKSHKEVVQFCLALGKHLVKITGLTPNDEIYASFEAMNEWLDNKTNYHKARNLSFEISRIAKTKNNPIEARFLRTMAQIAASPHVKYHGLWATDFAVTIVNRIHPDNMEAVRKEREKQIELISAV